ncbi:hypothetical protein EJ110_NYTH08583 [Nymphaea thermarum]|nr:hypothetical protein EJ110_NYTH08583 [Nymphaea thermarum]
MRSAVTKPLRDETHLYILLLLSLEKKPNGVEIISTMASSAMALLLVCLLFAAADIAALQVPTNSHNGAEPQWSE